VRPTVKNGRSDDDLIARLLQLPNEPARKKFLARYPRLNRPETVERLIAAVLAAGRVDAQRSLALAEAAVAISSNLKQKNILGLSLRCKANALYFAGKNQESLEFHAKALEIFEALNNEEEIGRTLTASLQPNILVGEHERAVVAANRARAIFTRLDDKRRLARLENNVGNIYHRQDRFEEALACYERAYEQFLPYGDSEELVAALSNMSMCLIFRAHLQPTNAHSRSAAAARCRCSAARPNTTSPISITCAANTAAASKCYTPPGGVAKQAATHTTSPYVTSISRKSIWS
jgi:tetratricopeptide (TPR) repeat protein